MHSLARLGWVGWNKWLWRSVPLFKLNWANFRGSTDVYGCETRLSLAGLRLATLLGFEHHHERSPRFGRIYLDMRLCDYEYATNDRHRSWPKSRPLTRPR